MMFFMRWELWEVVVGIEAGWQTLLEIRLVMWLTFYVCVAYHFSSITDELLSDFWFSN